MSKNNRINEISKELINRAADKQEKLLKSTCYLKKISAWQYLRCMKRIEDFRKYADAIVDAINTGNTGTPIDELVPQTQADEIAAEITAIKIEDGTSVSNPEDATVSSVKKIPQKHKTDNPVSVETRKKHISKNKPSNFNAANIICPRFPYASTPRPGKYYIKYISSLDDDICTVWVNARTINGAILAVKREFWDIKEIVDVIFETEYEKSSKPIITPDKNQPLSKVGSEVASVMTEGEFDNMSELMADILADKTTLECASGVVYVGETTHNQKWHGPKSSYKLTYDLNKGTATNSKYDHDVLIVTHINEQDVDDVTEPGYFNLEIFKKALHNGIVHFNYTKVDGNERQAYGTTKEDILIQKGAIGQRKYDEETGRYYSERSKSDKTFSYYDMTSNGWRSFIIENINTIYDESYYEIKEKTSKLVKARKNLTKKK